MAHATTADSAATSSILAELKEAVADLTRRLEAVEKRDAIREKETAALKQENATLREESSDNKRDNAALKAGKIGWWAGVVILSGVLAHNEIRHQQTMSELKQFNSDLTDIKVQGAETQKEVEYLHEGFDQLQEGVGGNRQLLEQVIQNQQQGQQ